MSFLGVVSWAFGLAALFGFSALVVVGRRDATTRRVATWTLWIAIVVQLAFVPFYARSLTDTLGIDTMLRSRVSSDGMAPFVARRAPRSSSPLPPAAAERRRAP